MGSEGGGGTRMAGDTWLWSIHQGLRDVSWPDDHSSTRLFCGRSAPWLALAAGMILAQRRRGRRPR